jgi:hypothetical protein
MDPFEITPAILDALATAAGLAIAPEHAPGVATNLAVLLSQARRLAAQPLAAEVEPAPVFRP